MSDKLNIEQLIRTRFDGAELRPSPASWKAIQRKLRWQQFLRFKPGRFNIYYAGALLLAATGLVLFLTGDGDQTEQTVPEDILLQPSQADNIADESAAKSIQIANPDIRKAKIQSDTQVSSNKTETSSDLNAQNQAAFTGKEEGDSEISLNKSELAVVTPDPSLWMIKYFLYQLPISPVPSAQVALH